MTASEYKKKKEELQMALEDLDKEYIESNSPYPVGCDVMYSNCECQVVAYGITLGKVTMVLNQYKADGELSPKQIFVFDNKLVRPID